jgi:S-adenosylmethionine hydrolase
MFNTSISHTYGNVLASIQKYILNKFEDKFFKTIHVQSRLAHRQLKSTPSEFLKKRKPAIAFRPRIDYNDNNAFLSNTLASGNASTKNDISL